MSKIIVFKDTTSIEVTDASTIYDVVTVKATANEVAVVADLFTVENLSEVTFDGVSYEHIIPVSMNAVRDAESGAITAHFINRELTDVEKLQLDMELQKAEQEIQNEAIDAIIMGTEEVVETTEEV